MTVTENWDYSHLSKQCTTGAMHEARNVYHLQHSILLFCEKLFSYKFKILFFLSGLLLWVLISKLTGGRRSQDCMVVGFSTTYAISAYHLWRCEFESRSGRCVQHFVIKFVCDLWQVSGFHRVLRFPPPIKLTATI
jgi:hypothetical protein